MSSWPHFLAGRDLVDIKHPSDSRRCLDTGKVPDESVSASSISVVLPGKFDPALDAVLLRSVSSNSLQGMSQNPSESSVGCLPVEALEESFGRPTETTQIPRRNLTEAFEELYVDTETPNLKQPPAESSDKAMKSSISPTGVAEFPKEEIKNLPEKSTDETNSLPLDHDDQISKIPCFDLHSELKRDLSESLVNRVSFYAVVHDINKEATAMAANDDSGYNRNPEDQHEEFDPLVVAVNGYPKDSPPESSSMVNIALIDEEKWLLDAINAKADETRSVNACPPTFPEAMGERDYENPLTSLSNGSRTQLWKPSRSWWEAKSGKNPWIEPKSHNKRWRYLWPLIHYHKFLARCIKKLKRNGVDVKTSVSPVSVFLREEVCAVSDHLASVSLFDSDQWMNCLQYFTGWTNSEEKAEKIIRKMVSKLKLRPLHEPGDVDSPLLRSQIDEQYLRAMASARAQMAGGGASQDERRSTKDSNGKQKEGQQGRSKQESSSKSNSQTLEGHPPAYPRQGSSPSHKHNPNNNGTSPNGMRRPRWGYPPQHAGHWWGNGWNSHGLFPFGDDTSVHSALSGDSFSQHHFDMNNYYGGMHHPPYHHPQMMYPQHQMQPMQPQGPYDPSVYAAMDGFSQDHVMTQGFVGHPMMGHIPSQASIPPVFPGSPAGPLPSQEVPGYGQPQADPSQTVPEPSSTLHTPYKYSPNQVPMSPYWGHLDHATLAMMGIGTPQAPPSAPRTPSRGTSVPGSAEKQAKTDANPPAAMNAQPLLLRQQYYGFGYGGREAYGPPSPATQFMMSPQANFAYNYGYGTSPRRAEPEKKNSKAGPDRNDQRNDVSVGGPGSPTASTTPNRTTSKNREGPSTIDTIAESDSVS